MKFTYGNGYRSLFAMADVRLSVMVVDTGILEAAVVKAVEGEGQRWQWQCIIYTTRPLFDYHESVTDHGPTNSPSPTDGPTDGPTDRRMDGLTDGNVPFYRDARTHLKSLCGKT